VLNLFDSCSFGGEFQCLDATTALIDRVKSPKDLARCFQSPRNNETGAPVFVAGSGGGGGDDGDKLGGGEPGSAAEAAGWGSTAGPWGRCLAPRGFRAARPVLLETVTATSWFARTEQGTALLISETGETGKPAVREGNRSSSSEHGGQSGGSNSASSDEAWGGVLDVYSLEDCRRDGLMARHARARRDEPPLGTVALTEGARRQIRAAVI